MNEHAEFTNTKQTFKSIADVLKKEKAVLIGWSDEEFTHFDILFTYKPSADICQSLNGTLIDDQFLSGSFQGGIRPSDLFVSIMRVGAFGFEIDHKDIDWSYYEEKLSGRMGIGETTSKKLAKLINGVKAHL